MEGSYIECPKGYEKGKAWEKISYLDRWNTKNSSCGKGKREQYKEDKPIATSRAMVYMQELHLKDYKLPLNNDCNNLCNAPITSQKLRFSA